MKESEISSLSPPAPCAQQGARYRYFSSPPTRVSLRLADIASQIPEDARLPAFDAEHSIELPCGEVFTGPTPKLLLSRLAEIASEHIRLDGVPDGPIRLPAARLALGYRFVNGRQLVEELIAAGDTDASLQEVFLPSEEFEEDISKPEETAVEGKRALGPLECLAQPEDTNSSLAVVAPPLAGSGVRSFTAADAAGCLRAEETASSLSTKAPQAAESMAPLSPKQEAALAQERPSPPVLESTSPMAQTNPTPEAWRPISIFPKFMRKEVRPPDPQPQIEVARPRAPFVPLEFSSRPPQPAPCETKAGEAELEVPAEQSAKELSLAAPVREAILVETEHLPKSESRRSPEIPNQDVLQALFMTEEFLSIDRVVELCGGLPGIKSCVLANGPAVLASHNVPESIDLVSLSAHALEMLAAMRRSATRMGIGAVPAVTIHSEKGPITFFHQDELCLLVLHKDRGFVPGVREKLQRVVEHLSDLALLDGVSRPVLPQKEDTF